MRYTYKRMGVNEIVCPGVDFGPVTVREVHREGAYAVWHIPGSTQWSSRGETSYYPTTFYVLKVERDATPGQTDGKADDVGYFESKDGKWRVAKREAIAKAHRLASEGDKTR